MAMPMRADHKTSELSAKTKYQFCAIQTVKSRLGPECPPFLRKSIVYIPPPSKCQDCLSSRGVSRRDAREMAKPGPGYRNESEDTIRNSIRVDNSE